MYRRIIELVNKVFYHQAGIYGFLLGGLAGEMLLGAFAA